MDISDRFQPYHEEIFLQTGTDMSPAVYLENVEHTLKPFANVAKVQHDGIMGQGERYTLATDVPIIDGGRLVTPITIDIYLGQHLPKDTPITAILGYYEHAPERSIAVLQQLLIDNGFKPSKELPKHQSAIDFEREKAAQSALSEHD